MLAPSHGDSWASLTMTLFRVELDHGAGVQVQTLIKVLPEMRGVVVAALSTAKPDEGVATPQLGPPSLGSLGPSEGKCGSRRRDYSSLPMLSLASAGP